MQTNLSGARLRTLRELLGRAGRDPEEATESAFTLIELMVVLLIMAILLAIAIPTFLSVTNGAKKTATQSDLTNALESATALYTKSTSFPVVAGTQPAAETTFLGDMAATQTTIKFVTQTTSPTAGKNVLSAWDANTGSVAVFSGKDGASVAWVAAINESSTPITIGLNTFQPGDTFTAYQDALTPFLPSTTTTTTAPPGTTTSSVTTALSKSRTWVKNFKTITGLT